MTAPRLMPAMARRLNALGLTVVGGTTARPEVACPHCGRPRAVSDVQAIVWAGTGRVPDCSNDRRASCTRAADPEPAVAPAPAARQQTGLSAVSVGGEYTADELEFLRAVEAWKKRTRTRFPAVSDLFRIAISLGYRKPTPGDADDRDP